MKKVGIYIFILITLHLLLGFSHGVYLDELFYFRAVDYLSSGDFDGFANYYINLGPTPLSFILSSFFVRLYNNIISYRIVNFLSSLAIFLIFHKITKNSFLALFTALSYPLFFTTHFLMTEPLSIVFILLSLLFFEKKNKYLGTLFSGIGFYAKQFSLGTLVVLLKDLKSKKIFKCILLLFLLLLPWLLFTSKYGNLVSPVGHSIDLNPIRVIKKVFWLTVMIGFVSFPFLLKNFNKKKAILSALLAVVVIFYSFNYLGTRSYTTEKENFKVHGRIPLLYHLLPASIYITVCYLFAFNGINFIFGSKINNTILSITGISLLIIFKAGENLPLVEIRYISLISPLILIECAKRFKVDKTVKLLSFLFIVYSLLWTHILTQLSNSSKTVRDFVSTNYPNSCAKTNFPIYNLNECEENPDIIISSSGFSEQLSIPEEYSLEKTFETKVFGKILSTVRIYAK